jgi:hypothetical protein
MNFKKINNIIDEGSCNFCNKGKITKDGNKLIFPYDKVILLEGKKISVVFCEECLDEFQNHKLI